jgi:hypothetical protein
LDFIPYERAVISSANAARAANRWMNARLLSPHKPTPWVEPELVFSAPKSSAGFPTAEELDPVRAEYVRRAQRALSEKADYAHDKRVFDEYSIRERAQDTLRPAEQGAFNDLSDDLFFKEEGREGARIKQMNQRADFDERYDASEEAFRKRRQFKSWWNPKK